MTLYAAPICTGCTHFHGFTEPKPEAANTGASPADAFASALRKPTMAYPGPFGTCDAFPDSISVAILTSEADHRKPFDGDHDIRYEPVSDKDAAYADLLFSLDDDDERAHPHIK